jgi:pimeloyl-ACP methyl ester carboxylesterase
MSLEQARATPGQRTLVPTARGTIAAIVVGERRVDRPEVVLVHGVTNSADTWRSVQGALAAETRVHAVDLPAHGLSDFPDHPLTVAEMADAVIAYLEVAGVSSAVIVGNSLGGGVALGLAARAPAEVSAVVALGSIGISFPVPFPLSLLKHRPFGLGMAWVVGAPIQRMVIRDSFAPGFRPDPRDVSNYFAGWRISGRAAAMRALLRTIDSGEPQPWLASIMQPVDVVHGELDQVIPPRIAHEVAGRLPHGRLTMLDGIGHEPQHECPEQVVAITLAALGPR